MFGFIRKLSKSWSNTKLGTGSAAKWQLKAFCFELDHAIVAVAEAPERWPTGGRGERRYVFPRFPFTLLYRVRGDEIFVTAVAHQSRRPGYWRHRK